ncbi:hypothetical protein [Dokdonella sp.]|uniref:hypothetical protein n=1 Tax=Dokdonella sp. TaxID=2291710 RepID=UPI001B1C5AC2|nr:hypothetical protein [Dokdonella sp.]MBO9663031.1 hypothetical protein [Dokdonella sp.]
MYARQTLLGAVSTVGLLFAASVAAQPTVVGFDDGAEGWLWTGGDLSIEADGGHPGAHAHLAGSDLGSFELRTDANAAFIGDFSASKGVGFSLDVKVESLNANGSPVSRDLIVELRSRALAQDGYPWASVWTTLGTLQATPDWTRYTVSFDPRSTVLPKGWHGTGAEDPVTFDPTLPPGVSFADVLAQVDEILVTTDKPGLSVGLMDVDLRADNLSIDRAAGPAPVTPPQYEIVDLGDFGGELANAHDINDAGHVAGTAEATNREAQAFFWHEGAMLNIGSLMPDNAPSYGVARGMSENDFLVGESMTPMVGFPGASVSHAFFWSEDTGMIDLTPGTDNMSQAWDVNSSGQVVGSYTGAFLWSQADGLRNIGLGGGDGAAEGINENGEVCGYEWNVEGTRVVGWVYDSRTGAIRELPSYGGTSQTRRINNAGYVVGSSREANFRPHSVLWAPDGQMTDLGVIPVPDYSPGEANALNEALWIVGADDYNGGGNPIGWLWLDGSKYVLRDLIADSAQHEAWSDLTTPLGINANNEIVGIGIRDGIPGRAFLMRPLVVDRIFVDGFEAK